jgi:hypothetical protein
MRATFLIRSCSKLTVGLALVALPACAASSSAELPAGGNETERPDAGTSIAPPPPSTPAPSSPPHGAGADDTPPPPGPPPLDGKVGEWTWLDVPESTCGNGEPTGMGVNIGTGTDLVIFLQGGGGCWDEITCAGIGTASNIKDGYKKENFEDEVKGSLNPSMHGGMFDRALSSNPFKDSSYIFIPYCTGDVHVGDATAQFLFPPRKMHFAGRRNIQAFLEKIVPAFQNASRVTFSGSSAGGFGAALNFWRVKDAFGTVRVDMIDDSGPPFEQDKMPLLGTWKKAWNMDGAYPAACEECKTNIAALTNYYATTYQTSRLSLLSYDHDNVISLFFVQSQDAFAGNLTSVADNRLSLLPNMRYFIVPGAHHTMLWDLSTTSANVKLGDWLTEMVTDKVSWANVAPQ